MESSTVSAIRERIDHLPPPLVRALSRRLGPSAQEWLYERLPVIVARCLEEWGLAWEAPLSGGATAAVIGVRDRASRAAVLKVHPDPQRAGYELLGYQRWQGRVLPRLLEQAPDVGALLFERVAPGTSQESNPGPDAAGCAAELLERMLTQDSVQELPPLWLRVDRWVDRAAGLAKDDDNAVPPRLVQRAAETAAALLVDTRRAHGLHGDFFPDNVLFSERNGWLAIDPATCRGDACFDAGTWCYAYGRGGAVEKNIPAFTARLGLSSDRVRLWAGVVATINLAGRCAYGHASGEEVVTTLDFAKSVLV
ncbi:MAG TPA: aminoglycoside phosphotransferase family protein [Mycobacteriales bacterium]|nr:aminoglycoside phosphotransferase family protein [Mycobacteriales bacterium]